STTLGARTCTASAKDRCHSSGGSARPHDDSGTPRMGCAQPSLRAVVLGHELPGFTAFSHLGIVAAPNKAFIRATKVKTSRATDKTKVGCMSWIDEHS